MNVAGSDAQDDNGINVSDDEDEAGHHASPGKEGGESFKGYSE